MPRFCSNCGTQIPDAATTCPSCNKAVSVGGGAAAAPASDSGTGGGMAQNVAGLLAYVTLIPAIIFLVAEPYKNNKFIKFHAWQNIFLAAAVFVLWIGLFILGMVLAFAGPVALIMLPINLIVWIGILVAWIMCLVKAYGNNVFKLPIIGNLAAKQAGL